MFFRYWVTHSCDLMFLFLLPLASWSHLRYVYIHGFKTPLALRLYLQICPASTEWFVLSFCLFGNRESAGEIFDWRPITMLWSTHSLFVAVVLASLLLPTCLAGSQAVARQTGRKCGPPPLEQCSFTDQFKYLNRKRWEVSHDTANGGPFDAWWSKYRVAVRPWNKLDLSISNTPNFNKRFAGAQVMSKRWYGYGCYVVRMKPVSYPG